MMWFLFFRERLVAFEKFKTIKDKVENESGMRIKHSRSNREYLTSNQFNNFCEYYGIKR